MTGYDVCHVLHAAVAKLDIVAVKDFMKAVVGGKMLVQEFEELFSYVGVNTVTIGRIEPDDVAFAFDFFWGMSIRFVRKVAAMSTFSQCLVVNRGCYVKNFFGA